MNLVSAIFQKPRQEHQLDVARRRLPQSDIKRRSRRRARGARSRRPMFPRSLHCQSGGMEWAHPLRVQHARADCAGTASYDRGTGTTVSTPPCSRMASATRKARMPGRSRLLAQLLHRLRPGTVAAQPDLLDVWLWCWRRAT